MVFQDGLFHLPSVVAWKISSTFDGSIFPQTSVVVSLWWLASFTAVIQCDFGFPWGRATVVHFVLQCWITPEAFRLPWFATWCDCFTGVSHHLSKPPWGQESYCLAAQRYPSWPFNEKDAIWFSWMGRCCHCCHCWHFHPLSPKWWYHWSLSYFDGIKSILCIVGRSFQFSYCACDFAVSPFRCSDWPCKIYS